MSSRASDVLDSLWLAFKVHKVVLCSQSQFFYAACSHACKESEESLIELPEDNVVTVEKMIEFFYTAKYTSDDAQDSQSPSNLTLHAELYAIADKYGLPTLADEAKSRFLNTTISASWDAHDFLDSIWSVYNLTPESDRGLRDIVVKCTRSHSRELWQGDFREILKTVSLKVPEFAFGLLDSFMEAPLLGYCSTCGPDQKVESLQRRCLSCGRGGAY